MQKEKGNEELFSFLEGAYEESNGRLSFISLLANALRGKPNIALRFSEKHLPTSYRSNPKNLAHKLRERKGLMDVKIYRIGKTIFVKYEPTELPAIPTVSESTE